jgi:hypothetical protein
MGLLKEQWICLNGTQYLGSVPCGSTRHLREQFRAKLNSECLTNVARQPGYELVQLVQPVAYRTQLGTHLEQHRPLEGQHRAQSSVARTTKGPSHVEREFGGSDGRYRIYDGGSTVSPVMGQGRRCIPCNQTGEA